MTVIPIIRNDNGFEECLSCLNVKSKVCKFCVEAELFEDVYGEEDIEKELEFA